MIMNIINPPIYQHYSSLSGGRICNGGVGAWCTFGNLTYNQFLRSEVLYYPLPAMGEIDVYDLSYVIYYQGYSTLTYPPEAWYYGARSQNSLPSEVTVADVYQGFQIAGLY